MSGMASSTALLEAMIRRDRLVLIAGMLLVSALAWGWLVLGSGMDMSAIDMTRMAGMDGWMMQQAVWTPAYALLIVSMWWIMMVAMMLPGAAPMLLLFARVNRKEKAAGSPLMPTSAFATGYLIAWAGFSVLATGLQWASETARLPRRPNTENRRQLQGGLPLISDMPVMSWLAFRFAITMRRRHSPPLRVITCAK